MTMHLVGPALTTTQYNKKKKKVSNKRLLDAQERHNEWLKSRGLMIRALLKSFLKTSTEKEKEFTKFPTIRLRTK
jgi:hypothetical protein